MLDWIYWLLNSVFSFCVAYQSFKTLLDWLFFSSFSRIASILQTNNKNNNLWTNQIASLSLPQKICIFSYPILPLDSFIRSFASKKRICLSFLIKSNLAEIWRDDLLQFAFKGLWCDQDNKDNGCPGFSIIGLLNI